MIGDSGREEKAPKKRHRTRSMSSDVDKSNSETGPINKSLRLATRSCSNSDINPTNMGKENGETDPAVQSPSTQTNGRPDALPLETNSSASASSMDSACSDTEGSHTPSLHAEYERQVRPFIDLIDNLRHFGLEKDIALPSIVVVGDQSAGKSSALEAISGIQLPRGSGIVTRCPLELRLKSCPPGTVWKARIKYEDGAKNKHEHCMDDPVEIDREIRKAQKVLAGDKKGISDDLISLEVEAENIPDLTLIDLPGITRVAAEGQSSNIPTQIKTMIKNYIKKEETIILAVVPANVDIVTTEALQMAKVVDPKGERTLGVVTKPDLVDRGAEADVVAVVNNQSYMLKKGYTIIKCRGQQAVSEGQTLEEAMADETDFFRSHEHFGALHGSLYGVKNLATKLTTELVAHIKKSLPQLKADVREKQEKTRYELGQLGAGLPESEEERMYRLMQILQQFTDSVKNAADGERGELEDERGLCNSVRSVYKTLAEEVHRITPRDALEADDYKESLEQGIIQHRGRELPRFMKYSVCETFIKKLVSQFDDPVHVCLEDVSQIISNLLARLAEHHLCNYPTLLSKVKGMVDEMRREAHTSCQMELDRLLTMEQSVFTQDSSYQMMLDIILKQKQEKEAEDTKRTGIVPLIKSLLTMSESELRRKDAESMYDMIMAYMEVAERRLTDLVPMNINYYLLRELVKKLRLEIMGLTRQEGASTLLEEQWQISQKRTALKDKLQRLNKASRELAKF